MSHRGKTVPHDEQVVLGIGTVGALAGAGAAIGAMTATPCGPSHEVFCGPPGGLVVGSAVGIAASGAIGVLFAIFSPKYRTAGLTAAGTVAAMGAVLLARNALQKTQS